MTESNKNSDQTSVLATMLGSASAGMISRVFCHPLDTAKARLQAPSSGTTSTSVLYKNTVDVLRQTVKTEGITAVYRGFFITMLGSAPATCMYLTTYEESKNQLLHRFEICNKVPFVTHFSAGIIAEAISCVLFVPIDVIKERLQVQKSSDAHAYKGTVDAIRTILHKEGLQGIYKGYGATLMSFGPFSAFYFLFYEKAKSLACYVSAAPNIEHVSLPLLLTSAATSGALASFITNPLDLVKLRLQIQRKDPAVASNEGKIRGLRDGLQTIMRQEGVRGLFRGASARMLFHAPMTAISMASFERCKQFFAEQLD